MKIRSIIVPGMLGAILHVGAMGGAAQELGDPGFEALEGKTVSRETIAGGWSIPPGQPHADGIAVNADKTAAHGGKVGLRLQRLANGRLAAIGQRVSPLAAGIYEFEIWARGEGVIVLKSAQARRRGDLGKDWAEYSLTFEQTAAGPVDLAILADGNAQVDDASLTPASPERQAAWKEQEKARSEYGFVPEYFSAQSPPAGAPAKPSGTFRGGPVTWREKVVFYDQRYDSAWSPHPEVLARYLGANGFRVLEAVPFGDWIRKATRKGAYGTVCVMTHGLCPGSVYDDQFKESAIRKYLEAGGRVVWIGDAPFYYVQDETHPQIFSKGGSREMLGVRAGWDYGCWGNQGEPKVSELGQAWGLADAGGPAIAAYPEDITAALSGFHSLYAASDLAVYWFKSFNPLFPWSGFVMGHRATDMANPVAQQSVYRLALYAGRPVEAPAGIAVAAKDAAPPPLKVTLDPPRNRRCYYRGEKVSVQMEAEASASPIKGPLRFVLVRGGASFSGGECAWPAKGTSTQGQLATGNLACGDYQLQLRATNDGGETVIYETTVSVCPRREDPTFFYGVSGTQVTNPYRQEILLKDLASSGMHMGSLTTDASPRIFDLSIKHGLRFGMRANPGGGMSEQERLEGERRGPNGETIPGAWEGGRPIMGLLHPRLRQVHAEFMAQQIKAMSEWPGCWPRSHVCDDFSVYYGWDYSDLAKATFTQKTGLDAPLPPELVRLKEHFLGCGLIDRPKGVVPDSDPWLQWSIFTTRDIVGGYNQAVTRTCAKAVPNLKIGPVPGPMQLPLWSWGQYPPHSFGAEGFNLLQYYYYLCYWQPGIGNLYWDEIARMNNRELELWVMPDCQTYDEPTYYRNTCFLHLTGGCQGINYYTYTEATPAAWKELGRIGNQVVRPLYPFLGKLRPVQTENGLLLPYTQFAHTPLYPTSAVYAYANLLGTHLEVQPTCEEEALSGYIGNYKALLLWHVEWMRESSVKALEDYIVKGGLVLADSATTVPIKGAVRLPVDLAMGAIPSQPDVNDPRLGGPGIKDYLHPDRVSAIGRAIAKYAFPWAQCKDPTLVVRRHAFRGVTYLWLVNIHNREEYEYVRERIGAGARPADPEKARKEAYEFLAQRAGQRFVAEVSIPAGPFVAYDVLKGQALPLNANGKRVSFTADMERLGGTLIALYPERIARVTATVTTDAGERRSRFLRWFGSGGNRIIRGQSATVRVTVSGPSGKPLAGTQPLAVTVTTPQGEWEDITGAHATEDGVWSATIQPAINDPVGTWKIRVKEISSGMVGETSFKVKN